MYRDERGFQTSFGFITWSEFGKTLLGVSILLAVCHGICVMMAWFFGIL